VSRYGAAAVAEASLEVLGFPHLWIRSDPELNQIEHRLEGVSKSWQ
jgi:hypothetical protein